MKNLILLLLSSISYNSLSGQNCFNNEYDVNQYMSRNNSFTNQQKNVTIWFSNGGGIFSTGTVGSTMYYLQRTSLISGYKVMLTYYDSQDPESLINLSVNCSDNTITDITNRNLYVRTKDIEDTDPSSTKPTTTKVRTKTPRTNKSSKSKSTTIKPKENNQTSISLNGNGSKDETPKQLYNRLDKSGLIDIILNNDDTREIIRYKGDKLNDSTLKKLDMSLKIIGYLRTNHPNTNKNGTYFYENKNQILKKDRFDEWDLAEKRAEEKILQNKSVKYLNAIYRVQPTLNISDKYSGKVTSINTYILFNRQNVIITCIGNTPEDLKNPSNWSSSGIYKIEGNKIIVTYTKPKDSRVIFELDDNGEIRFSEDSYLILEKSL